MLIERISYERICQELEAEELDNWQEYTLLKIDNADIKPIFLLDFLQKSVITSVYPTERLRLHLCLSVGICG